MNSTPFVVFVGYSHLFIYYICSQKVHNCSSAFFASSKLECFVLCVFVFVATFCVLFFVCKQRIFFHFTTDDVTIPHRLIGMERSNEWAILSICWLMVAAQSHFCRFYFISTSNFQFHFFFFFPATSLPSLVHFWQQLILWPHLTINYIHLHKCNWNRIAISVRCYYLAAGLRQTM